MCVYILYIVIDFDFLIKTFTLVRGDTNKGRGIVVSL